MIHYSCPNPNCGRVLAQEDDRLAVQRLVPLSGARLETQPGKAHRLRCKCGQVVILIKWEY